MKNKILSIALVLGILLGLSSGIPVSADEAPIPRSLPYAFFDFEDDVMSMPNMTIVRGGMGESAKSMRYTEGTSLYTDLLISNGISGEALVGSIPTGYKFTMTFHLKLLQKVTPGKLMLGVYGTLPDGSASSPVYMLRDFDGENTTDWQKVSFDFTSEQDITVTSMYLRFGSHGTVTNHVLGGSATEPRTYNIDDMTVSVIPPELDFEASGTPETPGTDNGVMSLDDYSMDFENGSSMHFRAASGLANVTSTAQSNGKETMQLIQDPANSANKVMKVVLGSETRGSNSTLNFSNSKTTGSSVATAYGTVPAGGKITYSFRYYLATEVESVNHHEIDTNGDGVNDETIDANPAFCVANIVNGATKFAVSEEPFGTTANEWHEATLTYTNDTSEAVDVVPHALRYEDTNARGMGNYTNWVAKGHAGFNFNTSTYDLGERVIYFDDFVVKTEAPEPSDVSKTDRLVSLADYSLKFENGSYIANNAGQFATNAEVANGAGFKMQLVQDPVDSTNTAMKLTIPSDMSGGSWNASMTLRNSTGNMASAVVPDGHKIVYIFRYYLGQEVETSSTDGTDTYYPSFCVHNTGADFAKSDENLATTSGEWHTAILTYANTSGADKTITQAQFRLTGDNKDGKEKYKDWVVKGHGGWNGSSADYGERVFYIDDFRACVLAVGEDIPSDETEEPNEPETPTTPEEPTEPEEPTGPAVPVSSAIRVVGEFREGQKITFNHDFESHDGIASDKSLVRLMHTTEEGITASLSSCIVENSFTVPKLPESGSYVFEVVPVDGAGVLGRMARYRYAQVVGQEIKLEMSGFDNDGNVKAVATVDNQRDDGKDINAVLFIIMQDEKGVAVNCAQMPIICVNGNRIAGEAGTLVLESDNLSKAKKATAFLWDCAENGVPTIDNTTMVELAQKVTVTKQ